MLFPVDASEYRFCTDLPLIVEACPNLVFKMAEFPKAIGWVGLGLMGYPMIGNLLKKLSSDTQFHVYDVMPESIEKIVKDGAGRVHACATSREVADQSVRMPRSWCRVSPKPTMQLTHSSIAVGYHTLDGSRGKPRAFRLSDP